MLHHPIRKDTLLLTRVPHRHIQSGRSVLKEKTHVDHRDEPPIDSVTAEPPAGAGSLGWRSPVSTTWGLRPIGITLLAVLHLAGATIASCMIIPTLTQLGQPKEVYQQIGVHPAFMTGSIVLALVLGFGSGIGMLMGRAWGWYLGSFYYIYSVAKCANALLMIHAAMAKAISDDASPMSHPPSYYSFRFGFRAGLYVLIYAYFFKANVREYFGLSKRRRWKDVTAEIGVCGIIGLTVSVGSALLGYR